MKALVLTLLVVTCLPVMAADHIWIHVEDNDERGTVNVYAETDRNRSSEALEVRLTAMGTAHQFFINDVFKGYGRQKSHAHDSPRISHTQVTAVLVIERNRSPRSRTVFRCVRDAGRTTPERTVFGCRES